MTRRPFKWVPLLLPRSTNENSEPPCACTKAWRRDTLGEVKTTLLSFARPSENVFPTKGNCRSPISSRAARAAFSIPPIKPNTCQKPRGHTLCSFRHIMYQEFVPDQEAEGEQTMRGVVGGTKLFNR